MQYIDFERLEQIDPQTFRAQKPYPWVNPEKLITDEGFRSFVAAELAKLALLRPINKKNPDANLERYEERLLDHINGLKIGPMGLGGRTTALGLNILDFPTHIAGLPVAVCVSCHATRSAERVL